MSKNGSNGTGIPPVSKRFDTNLRRLNGLDDAGFREWLFLAPMLFGSSDKWWGERGRRDSPHEGLDLCYYRTADGKIQRLSERARVPVAFDGEVVNVIQDFLGKSVFVRHSDLDNSGSRLYTVYSHIEPSLSVSPGASLAEGDIIGVVSAGRFAHLHLSAAWIPNSFPADKLDWKAIGGPGVVLIDPLSIISWQYSVVERV